MQVLVSYEVNPLVVPHLTLGDVLLILKKAIQAQPEVELPDDSDENIWVTIQ